MTAHSSSIWPVRRLGRRVVVASLVALLSVACDACGNNAGSQTGETKPSMVGTWRGATTMGCLGLVSDEIIFEANGKFSRLTTSSQVNCVPGSLMVRTTGNYEVDSTLGVINLTNIDTEPKEQCLPGGGCQPITNVTSDTIRYTMPDSNTLMLSCGSGCVITYARVSP